ncbi:hypothetical protein ACIPSE_18155 [Streptomyces sp. NPDC090106]|uniref:hypothetical protein n=1 Tax=Streptomyces sp. NPDC090106 TaxID=3365946 RepID=UPI0037F50824
MAGRRRVRGAWAVCLLFVSLVACGGGPATDGARAEVQGLLDRRANAVLDRDQAAFRRTGALDWFENTRGVPFAAWGYRLTGLRRDGDDAVADVELSYRIQGYDNAPVSVGRRLTLTRDASGGWYVERERPAGKAAQQLWDQGAVAVVRGASSLVLGVGQSSARLQVYADLADRAVPAVSGEWGRDWSRHVVVLVPKSLEGMAGLLGSPASSYRGIAAVTTGETGAPADAPADRIIVNTDAYGVLGDVGKQVVLTHETTHVATRAVTSAATPLWLSEGYADWIGYLASGRTPVEAAPELARAVTGGDVPEALPVDADFGFSGDATQLARAYEGGWMACRMIAARWGEDRLGDFYRAVGPHRQRAGAVEDALHDVLDTDLDTFTADWRDYLEAELG